jgi:methyl-accepting chemotaxis protein
VNLNVSIKARLVIATMGIPTLMLLALAYATSSAIGRMSATSGWVEHTHRVIGKAESLLSDAVDMETGMRGFLLAGQESFLEPYERGATSFFSGITELKATVADNPPQVGRLDQIEDVIRTWRNEVTAPAIELRRSIGDDKSMNDVARRVAEDAGAHHSEAINDAVELFASRERSLLLVRDAAVTGARVQIDESVAALVSAQSRVERSYAVMRAADEVSHQATRAINSGDLSADNPPVVRLQALLDTLQTTVSDNPEHIGALINIRARLIQSDNAAADDNERVTLLTWMTEAMQTLVTREQTVLTGQLREFEQTRTQLEKGAAELDAALQLTTHTHKALHTILEIEDRILTLESRAREYLLTGNTRALGARDAARADATALLNELQKAVVDNPPQVTLLDEIKRNLTDWEQVAMAPLVALRAEVNGETTMDDMARLVGEARGKALFDRFRSMIAEFVAIEEGLMVERQATAAQVAERARVIVITGVGLALFALFILGLNLIRSVTRPISTMVTALRQLATGDLCSKVDLQTRGEIGEMASAYNDATEKTSRTMLELLNVTKEIDIGTSKVNTTTTVLANGVTEQVDNAETVNQALHTITASTRETADTTSQAASLARDSREAAERGQTEMTEMVDAMKGIESSSADISKILTDIDEIAFQTNLLSLNAAVEAARAGDAGRGFAVVAEEVRGLAQRSAAAARNSSTLIEQSNERSKRGVELAQKVGEALNEISQRTDDVSVLMNQVESASAKQTRSIEDVETGVRSFNDVTRKNADSTQELSAVADTTTQQVARVRELVGQFSCE